MSQTNCHLNYVSMNHIAGNIWNYSATTCMNEDDGVTLIMSGSINKLGNQGNLVSSMKHFIRFDIDL